MLPHHLFVFTDEPDAAAKELLDFGLLEGSSRVHPGQGTRNRKFYFRNFYLEILWVHNTSEIQSPITAPTLLWERACYKTSGFSPFGICLHNSPETDELFLGSLRYQPVYLPAGMAIEMCTYQKTPYLPCTFRLPLASVAAEQQEPLHHQPGLKELTRLTFGIPASEPFAEKPIFGSDSIHLKHAPEHSVILQFDNHHQGKVRQFNHLPLTLEY